LDASFCLSRSESRTTEPRRKDKHAHSKSLDAHRYSFTIKKIRECSRVDQYERASEIKGFFLGEFRW